MNYTVSNDQIKNLLVKVDNRKERIIYTNLQ